MKQVWITALEENKEQVQKLMSLLKTYGLDSNGSYWIDDLKKHAWLSHKERICDSQTDLWIILGSEKSIQPESVRYGLSLLVLSVQAAKGNGFPIVFISGDNENIPPETLPASLENCTILAGSNPALGPKIVAKANMPAAGQQRDYRINVHAHERFGLWFEAGPSAGGVWNGAILGTDSGEIDFHGVGTAGALPEKAVLEYPVKRLKLQSYEREFTAWAVQNEIGEDMSYYVRVHDIARHVLFGPYSSEDELPVTILQLV